MAALFKVMRYASVMSVEDPVDIATIKVLASIAELGGCRGSDIAGNIHLDLSTVSRHLAALEKQGFVRKTPDPSDGRASRVELTEDGYSVMRKMLENRAAAIAPVLATWDDSDRDQLFSLLTRLARELHSESAARRASADAAGHPAPHTEAQVAK